MTPCVQSHGVNIQDQVLKQSNTAVGSRLKLILQAWKTLGSHGSILNLIAEGYKLPFRECPTLSRTPSIASGYNDFNKWSALSTSIQDLLRKGAVDTVQKPDSLGFNNRLFLVPKPGNCWRPVIDLSCLNKFLAFPKTPESIRASIRRNEWVMSINLRGAYETYLFIPNCRNISGSATKASCTSLPAYPLASPRPHWFSPAWSRKSVTVSLAIRNPYSSIPGRLADSRPFQRRAPRTDSKTVKVSEGFGLGSESQEIRTGTLPEIRLPRIPFFTRFGSYQAHSRQVDETADVTSPLLEVCYQCKDSYVHHWITCINGEDSQTGQDAYETFSVASQDSLEISDASGHTNPLESEDDMTKRSSNKFLRYGRVPKWTCLQPAWIQNFLCSSLRSRILRLGQ